MSLQFAYYPGCAAKQVQKEADGAAHAVCSVLGITLTPMPRATCCGAVSLRETHPDFALATNARILSEAEALGLDILTVCNTCTQTLSYSNHRLVHDEGLRSQINAVLEQAGVRPYGGGVRVRHLVWVLMESVDREVLQAHIKHPLNGLRVAPFYGCHNLRPAGILDTRQAGERADHLDRLIELMGGVPVAYPGRDRCCGFHVMLSDAREMRTMVANNCLSAKEQGAEVMITPCTLCDMAMGSYQKIAADSVGVSIDLPEMNFAQLLGVAMGLNGHELGLSRLHLAPYMAFLRHNIEYGFY
ncbi:MAG: CoB--CoM heterodisulfide reductase iron-sulfur subunit B family protein [Magnetococcus sp. WYHC-3]